MRGHCLHEWFGGLQAQQPNEPTGLSKKPLFRGSRSLHRSRCRGAKPLLGRNADVAAGALEAAEAAVDGADEAAAVLAPTGLTLVDRWDVTPATSNQWWVRWRKD